MDDSQNWAEAVMSSKDMKKARLRMRKKEENEERRKEQKEKAEITGAIGNLSAFMQVEFPKAKIMLEEIEGFEGIKALESLNLDSRIKVVEEEIICGMRRPHIYLTVQEFGYMEQTLPFRGRPYGIYGGLKEMIWGKYRFKKISIPEIVRMWSERKTPSELLPYIQQEFEKKAESSKKARNILLSQ